MRQEHTGMAALMVAASVIFCLPAAIAQGNPPAGAVTNPPAQSSPLPSATPLPSPAPGPAPLAPGSPSLAPLTPEQSVAFAIQHNPQMAVAAAQRSLALAKLIPQRPGFHPDVEASAWQSLEGPTLDLPLAAGPRPVVPRQEHQVALTADQVLYHPGAAANKSRVAAQVSSADAAYADAIAAVRHDVLTAYYQALQAEAAEGIAHQAVADVQGSVDRVKILMQAGQAVPLDLLTAQSALSQVQQDEAAATNGLVVARANLNLAMGRPLETPIRMAAPGRFEWAPPASADDAIRIALATRPDIKQREADLATARTGLTLAHTESGPTVHATASYALQNSTALQNTNEWMLRATISLPILQTAAQRSDVAQAAAGVQAAEAGLQALRDGDALLVLKAWSDLQTAQSALTADASAVSEQQEAVRAAGLRRQVAEVTESDVAQARLKLEQALSTQTRDTYNVSLKIIDLQYAMGILSLPAGKIHPSGEVHP